MINAAINHDKHYPPSASAGGNNAYYLKGCDTVQRSPSYAACLFKIAEVGAGRESDYNRECAVAIRSRQCGAANMRQEEELKGQALFYFPRIPPQLQHLPFAVAGDFGVRITNLTDPALIPRDATPRAPRNATMAPAKSSGQSANDKQLDAELGAIPDDYAAAINAAIAAMPAPPQPKPAPAKAAAAPAPPAVLSPATKSIPTSSARPPMAPGETPLQYARRLAALKTTT